MATPTQSWDEGSPSGIQAISLLGERLRELKTQIREIFGVDHIMNSSGSGNTWGYHKKLTLYNLSESPLVDANTGILFAKDVDSKSELHWLDEDDNEIQFTSNGQFIAGMVGEIRMYRGALADIPEGWALADGLCAKFIRGVATAVTNPGGSGGSDSITLTESHITTHTHSLTVPNPTTSTHAHYVNLALNVGSGTTALKSYDSDPVNRYSGIVVGAGYHGGHSISNAGSGTAYDNRPAFIEEGFIIKV